MKPIEIVRESAARFSAAIRALRGPGAAPAEVMTGRRARAADFSLSGLPLEAWPFMQDEDDLPPHLAAATIPTVFGCIDLIKSSLAKLPLRFYLGEESEREEVSSAPRNVVELWRKPNAFQSGFALIEEIQASLDLNGNAYLHLETDSSGFVREMVALPSHLVRPIVGRDGTLARYEIATGRGVLPIAPEVIVHFRYWNPAPGMIGMAPMSPAMMSYKTQRLAQRWNHAIYLRGGEATGYFVSEDRGIDTPKRERLELRIKQRHQGPENAGRAIILPPGLKRESSMLTHDQMKFIESYRLTKSDVFEVFGIPPWMKGQKDGGSLGDSGAGTDERLFWENCIEPRATRIAQTITARMLEPIAPGLHCEFDLSGVFALQKVFLEKAKAIRESLGTPCMTVNEGREYLGLPALDDPKFDLPPAPASPLGAPGAAAPSGPDSPGAPGAGDAADPPAPESSSASRDATAAPESSDRERIRAEFRSRHDANLARFERRMERAWTGILSAQSRRIVEALEASGVRELAGARDFDLEHYLAADDAELEELRRVLTHIVETRGEEALAELVRKVDFSMTAAQASGFIRTRAQRGLALVNEETKARLRESIAQGIQSNEGLGEIVARVRQVFEDRKANAVTIARTETAPAYNFATTEAWAQSSVVEGKEWVTIIDGAERPHHEAANGQVVGLEEDFAVGGEALSYPGDVRGSAGNVINCRCGMLAVMKTDARMSPAARWFSRTKINGATPSNRLREFFTDASEAPHANGHH